MAAGLDHAGPRVGALGRHVDRMLHLRGLGANDPNSRRRGAGVIGHRHQLAVKGQRYGVVRTGRDVVHHFGGFCIPTHHLVLGHRDDLPPFVDKYRAARRRPMTTERDKPFAGLRVPNNHFAAGAVDRAGGRHQPSGVGAEGDAVHRVAMLHRNALAVAQAVDVVPFPCPHGGRVRRQKATCAAAVVGFPIASGQLDAMELQIPLGQAKSFFGGLPLLFLVLASQGFGPLRLFRFGLLDFGRV